VNSQYAYIVTVLGEIAGVFTWPNCVKKYLRDVYTIDGELHLPPEGHITLTRHKVNPKAAGTPVKERIHIERFLET
jgi:hypothetical protein